MQKDKIDINCDLGETDILDTQFLNNLMPFISSANVSCGAHAGSEEVIKATIRKASEFGVRVGAHPSYPDRVNFGRKSMKVSQETFTQFMEVQLDYFYSLCKLSGVKVHHIKPHGALYNDMSDNEELAEWFIRFVKKFDPEIIVYGLAHSRLGSLTRANNIKFKAEGFLDRRYTPELKLVSRTIAGAVISNPELVLKQLDELLTGELIIDEEKIKIDIDTLCLHGDTSGAVLLAEKVFNHLKNKNIAITSA